MIKKILIHIYLELAKAIKAIKSLIYYSIHFNLSIGMLYFTEIINHKKIGYSEHFISRVQKYMDKILKPKIIEYLKRKNNYTESRAKTPVWFCWLQGENKMPIIPKICYNKIKKIFNNNATEVVFIDINNYGNYIQLPKYIIKKKERNLIGAQHFSDILRWGLVSKYGGFWIDATILITYDDINVITKYLEMPFYTHSFYDTSSQNNEPSKGKWTNFYFFGNNNQTDLFNYVYDSLLYYWKKYNHCIHYVFLDYIIMSGYKNVERFKTIIDNIPKNKNDIWFLHKNISNPCSDIEWSKIMNSNHFYKLNHRDGWIKKKYYSSKVYLDYLLDLSK